MDETGTDPPDMVRTHPCALKEAWIDPTQMLPEVATQSIGENLEKQYKALQPRWVQEYWY